MWVIEEARASEWACDVQIRGRRLSAHPLATTLPDGHHDCLRLLNRGLELGKLRQVLVLLKTDWQIYRMMAVRGPRSGGARAERWFGLDPIEKKSSNILPRTLLTVSIVRIRISIIPTAALVTIRIGLNEAEIIIKFPT
jgi:hypothetical protein